MPHRGNSHDLSFAYVLVLKLVSVPKGRPQTKIKRELILHCESVVDLNPKTKSKRIFRGSISNNVTKGLCNASTVSRTRIF